MIESCLSLSAVSLNHPLHPLFPSRFFPFPLLASAVDFSEMNMEQLKSTPSSSTPRKSYSKEYLMSFASLDSCKEKWPHNLHLGDVNSELPHEVLEWRKSATTIRRSSIKGEKTGQRKINHKMPMVHSLGSPGLRSTYRTGKEKRTLKEGMSRSYEDTSALSHEHINLEGVVDLEDKFVLTGRKRIVGFSPLVGLKEESNAPVQVKVSQEMRLGKLSKGSREDYSSDRSNVSSSFESCSDSDVTQESLTLLKMKESGHEENLPCTTVPKTIFWRSLLTQNDLADNEETHIAAEHATSIKKVTANPSRLSDDLWHSLTGNQLDQSNSIDADENELHPLQTKGKNFFQRNENLLSSDSDEASPISNDSTDTLIGSGSSSRQKIDLLEALFVLEGHRVLPMPAAPTLEDIEKDIISTTTSEIFLTCQDVEQSILADTKVSGDLGDGGSPTFRWLEGESNGINKAASEHILSLLQKGSGAAKRLAENRAGAGENSGNNESEKELFGELVSKVPISSELSNLDGVLQRYELIAAADFEQANKSVNKEANFGREDSQEACFASAAATNFGMDNSQQACLTYAATVDSLRTSIDRGAVETFQAQEVKPKDGSEGIPKASKAEVNSCNPSQKVSGDVEFFEHSCLKLKDSEATSEAGYQTESESKRSSTRKLQKEPPKVSSTVVSIAEASRSSYGAGITPQRPVLPTTSFWQTIPPLALIQQQQQHWQHTAVKVPQVGLLRPMSYTPSIMPAFLQTRPTTTPLVPQALQALQRLVDHQLEILNNIPGEVTPGMLHQRLSRSLYGSPGFQQTGQQFLGQALLAGFSPGITPGTSSYVPFTRIG